MSLAALTSPDAAAAREAARGILREGRFHPPAVPRPLHGVLAAIGDVLREPFRLLGQAISALGRILPGGAATGWVLLGLVVVAVVALVAHRYSRRALIRTAQTPAGRAERPLRASELMRLAEEAEREGRLEDAVRLRFRAGLASLNERGMIGEPAAIPTIEVARSLHSPRFHTLARRFEAIAYGAAPAAPEDVQEARHGWSAVLAGSERE